MTFHFQLYISKAPIALVLEFSLLCFQPGQPLWTEAYIRAEPWYKKKTIKTCLAET